jgi:predicted nucleotidyltransferase
LSEKTYIQIKNLNEIPIELNFEVSHIRILILFGSRARGDHDEQSDWDFAVLYDRDHPHNILEIYRALSEVYSIPEERIDVVDLDRASELITHHIARDGQLIYEREVGMFTDFKRRSLLSDENLDQYRQKSRQAIEQFLLSKGV